MSHSITPPVHAGHLVETKRSVSRASACRASCLAAREPEQVVTARRTSSALASSRRAYAGVADLAKVSGWVLHQARPSQGAKSPHAQIGVKPDQATAIHAVHEPGPKERLLVVYTSGKAGPASDVTITKESRGSARRRLTTARRLDALPCSIWDRCDHHAWSDVPCRSDPQQRRPHTPNAMPQPTQTMSPTGWAMSCGMLRPACPRLSLFHRLRRNRPR